MNYKTKLHGISTFVFDVDGVFTNGHILILPGQEPIRTFHSKDGYALQVALRQGYRIAIITGGKSEAVKERFVSAGISDVWLGARHKEDALEELMLTYELKAEEIAYMGDDLPDYEVLTRVGLATCPHDAAPEIRRICDYISPINGGEGCVRDLIEQTLKVHGKWNLPSDRNW